MQRSDEKDQKKMTAAVLTEAGNGLRTSRRSFANFKSKTSFHLGKNTEHRAGGTNVGRIRQRFWEDRLKTEPNEDDAHDERIGTLCSFSLDETNFAESRSSGESRSRI
ncbi:hypothetical protein V3C99_006555 [Haemonchus contortus]